MEVIVDGVVFRINPWGGVSRYFKEVLERVAQHCDDIHVVVDRVGISHGFLPSHPRIEFLPEWNRMGARLQRRVRKIIGTARPPQIFHTTYYTEPYSAAMRSVVTVYDMIDAEYPVLQPNGPEFVARQRRTMEKADIVIAISNHSAAQIQRYTKVRSEKIRVIHLGATEAFRTGVSPSNPWPEELNRRTQGRPYWLYVGMRDSYKNFSQLLRSYVGVADELGTDLVVVGGRGGFQQQQIELIISSRLEKRIHFFPQSSDDLLHAAYSGALALVYTSIDEGFGIPLVEAMSSGAPVLASDIDVMHEVAGGAALYFDPRDDGSLIARMREAMAVDVRRGMVDRGRAQSALFSWDACAKAHADIYRELAI